MGPGPVHARDGDPVPPPRELVQAFELHIIPDLSAMLSAEFGDAVEERLRRSEAL
jgi:hypothetical protein